MTAVDSAVRDFSITLYPPTMLNAVFLCVALAALLVAGTWLGMRLYLHLFGARADGTVTESVLRRQLAKGNEFSTSKFVYTRHLKIEFTDADGVKHTVKGSHYSNTDDQRSADIPQVGGTVAVLYSRAHPALAMYYDPVWHYIVPVASLLIAFLLSYAAVRVSYEDLRNMNALSLGEAMREQFDAYHTAIIESGLRIIDHPDDPAAYERRADAAFATVQFGDAIRDYGEALRLHPDGRELLLKRAKAEWLDGRDGDALRDWWMSR